MKKLTIEKVYLDKRSGYIMDAEGAILNPKPYSLEVALWKGLTLIVLVGGMVSWLL